MYHGIMYLAACIAPRRLYRFLHFRMIFLWLLYFLFGLANLPAFAPYWSWWKQLGFVPCILLLCIYLPYPLSFIMIPLLCYSLSIIIAIFAPIYCAEMALVTNGQSPRGINRNEFSMLYYIMYIYLLGIIL